MLILSKLKEQFLHQEQQMINICQTMSKSFLQVFLVYFKECFKANLHPFIPQNLEQDHALPEMLNWTGFAQGIFIFYPLLL